MDETEGDWNVVYNRRNRKTMSTYVQLDSITSQPVTTKRTRKKKINSENKPNKSANNIPAININAVTTEQKPVTKEEYEVIDILKQKLESSKGAITLQSLTGHIGSFPLCLRKAIGAGVTNLTRFLIRHKKYFVHQNNNVYLSEDRLSISQTVSSNQKETACFIRGDVIDKQSVRLKSGNVVRMSDSISKTSEIEAGDAVLCDVTKKKNGRLVISKLEIITKSIKSIPQRQSKSTEPIRAYTGVVVQVHPDFGLIKHHETLSEIYFHKDDVQCEVKKSSLYLDKILKVGDKVVLDADVIKDHPGHYRAIRVVKVDGNSNEIHKTAVDGAKEIYSANGRIVKINGSFGFIQRNENERVFFHKSQFYHENEQLVNDLTEYLQLDNLVFYDADTCDGNKNCKWRAKIVWTRNPNKVDSKISTEGHVLWVKKSHGLISIGSHHFNDRVFFTIDKYFQNREIVSDLRKVLTKNSVVNVEATTKTFDCDVDTKWVGSCVWVGQAPKTIKTSYRNMTSIENGVGYIKKSKLQRGIIEFDQQTASFGIDDFYKDGVKVLNLDWCIKVGDEINFDAVLNESGAMCKWKAMIVWIGDKPRVKTYITKKNQIEEYLKVNNPLIGFENYVEDIPIISVLTGKEMKNNTAKFKNLSENCGRDEMKPVVQKENKPETPIVKLKSLTDVVRDLIDDNAEMKGCIEKPQAEEIKVKKKNRRKKCIKPNVEKHNSDDYMTQNAQTNRTNLHCQSKKRNNQIKANSESGYITFGQYQVRSQGNKKIKVEKTKFQCQKLLPKKNHENKIKIGARCAHQTVPKGTINETPKDDPKHNNSQIIQKKNKKKNRNGKSQNTQAAIASNIISTRKDVRNNTMKVKNQGENCDLKEMKAIVQTENKLETVRLFSDVVAELRDSNIEMKCHIKKPQTGEINLKKKSENKKWIKLKKVVKRNSDYNSQNMQISDSNRCQQSQPLKNQIVRNSESECNAGGQNKVRPRGNKMSKVEKTNLERQKLLPSKIKMETPSAHQMLCKGVSETANDNQNTNNAQLLQKKKKRNKKKVKLQNTQSTVKLNSEYKDISAQENYFTKLASKSSDMNRHTFRNDGDYVLIGCIGKIILLEKTTGALCGLYQFDNLPIINFSTNRVHVDGKLIASDQLRIDDIYLFDAQKLGGVWLADLVWKGMRPPINENDGYEDLRCPDHIFQNNGLLEIIQWPISISRVLYQLCQENSKAEKFKPENRPFVNSDDNTNLFSLNWAVHQVKKNMAE